jgi:hypothetical protein
MANDECRIDMGAWSAVTFLRRDLLPADYSPSWNMKTGAMPMTHTMKCTTNVLAEMIY